MLPLSKSLPLGAVHLDHISVVVVVVVVVMMLVFMTVGVRARAGDKLRCSLGRLGLDVNVPGHPGELREVDVRMRGAELCTQLDVVVSSRGGVFT